MNNEIKENNGYKITEVGRIPREWEVNRLSYYIAELQNGISINAGDRACELNEYGILKTSSISTQGFIPSENKVIQEKETINLKVKPKKDNLIIVRKNTPELVGMVNYVNKDYDNLFLPDLLWQTVFKEDKIVNKKYIYYYLNTEYYNSTIKKLATGSSNSFPNITKDNFLNIKIAIPTKNEQDKIVNILNNWDNIIELKQKLLKEKENQKKGLIERLSTGKVRLSEFNDEWKKIKISEIFDIRNEKSKITDRLELYSLTIDDGVTAKSDRYNREFLVKDDNKKYKITKFNDIVYNPANLRFGAIALNKIEKDVLLSPIYETLYVKDNEKYDVNFISQILTSEHQIKSFSTMAEGTLVERMSVKIKDFINFKISVPNNIEEQRKISTIIDNSQKEIELLKKEIELLKDQKKGLMQLLLTGIVRV